MEEHECLFVRINDEWIIYCCNNCEEYWVFDDGDVIDNKYNYCPNCGFKIKGTVEIEDEREKE